MPTEANNTWLADVVLAFRSMEDGRAWMRDLYEWVFRNRPNRPKNYDAVIRATIYAHSSDSPVYVRGNPDVFRKVAHGIWALRFPEEQVPQNARHLWPSALAAMSADELQSFSGRGGDFLAEVDRRATKLGEKFNMTYTRPDWLPEGQAPGKSLK